MTQTKASLRLRIYLLNFLPFEKTKDSGREKQGKPPLPLLHACQLSHPGRLTRVNTVINKLTKRNWKNSNYRNLLNKRPPAKS